MEILYDGLFQHLPRNPARFESLKGCLSFPFALGLSGIGKTRIGRVGIQTYVELFSNRGSSSSGAIEHLSEPEFSRFVDILRDCLYIRVGLETIGRGKNAEDFVARVILFEWLQYNLSDRQSEEELKLKCANTNFKNLTIASVLDAIFQSGEFKCVYIHIDEADKGIEYIIELLVLFGSYFATGKRLLFFVSGIKTTSLISTLSRSPIKPVPIYLPPLELDHMNEIMRSILPNYDVENRRFAHLLWLTGGIPKYLVDLLGAVAYNANMELGTSVDTIKLVAHLNDLDTTSFVAIMNRFKCDLSFFSLESVNPLVYHHLVALSLSRIPMYEDTKLNGDTFPLSKAEEDQLLCVHNSVAIIPPILLSYFYGNIREPCMKMLQILKSLNCTQTSRENEALLPTVLYYRIVSAIQFLQVEKVTLGYLLGDVNAAAAFHETVVTISGMSSEGVAIVKKTITGKASVPKLPGIYLNTPTAPFADAVVVFPELTLFIREMSSTVANAAHPEGRNRCRPSNAVIFAEYEKVGSAMKKNDLFLFITDDDDSTSSEPVLPDNCVVICKDEHEGLFGSLVANLRKYVLCDWNDTNQNMTAHSTGSSSSSNFADGGEMLSKRTRQV